MSSAAPHIVVATPCIAGQIGYRYQQSAAALLDYCNTHGIGISVEMITHDPLEARARNTLTAKFLDRPRASHLLFAGADIGFSVPQALRLISAAVDVAAILAPPADGFPAPERLCAPRRQHGDFLAADCAGLDFMLIRRTVFTRLFAANRHLRYNGETGANPAFRSVHQYALFDSYVDPDSREYLCGAEAFCRRWRKIGGEIWIDGTSRTLRAAPHDYSGIDVGIAVRLDTAS